MFSFAQGSDIVEAGYRFSLMAKGMKVSLRYNRPVNDVFVRSWVGSRSPYNPRPLRHRFALADAMVGSRYEKVPVSMAAAEMRRAGLGPAGAIFGRPLQGASQARHAFTGWGTIAALDLGVSLAVAPHGKRMEYAAGSAAGVAGGVAGTWAGTVFGGPIGGLIGGLAGDWLARTPVMRGMEKMAHWGREMRHLDVGDFRDSQMAYTMRQRAGQELGRSLLNARQYLGKEAAMLHQ